MIRFQHLVKAEVGGKVRNFWDTEAIYVDMPDQIESVAYSAEFKVDKISRQFQVTEIIQK